MPANITNAPCGQSAGLRYRPDGVKSRLQVGDPLEQLGYDAMDEFTVKSRAAAGRPPHVV